MQRLPEPELMDDDAQARAYAEADFSEPHDHFVALLRTHLPDLPANGVGLDLGCGPGDVTLRVARALPGWQIDGLDASPAMLRYGRRAVARAGIANRVVLHQGYLPEVALPRTHYDLVFSNSLLHHLSDPSTLWRALRCWTAPGSAIFVMDLLRPPDRYSAKQLVERYSGSEPAILQRDFFNSLLAAYRQDELSAQLAAAQLSHLQLKQVSDRHLIVWGRL